jgi:hypothetical protein
MKENHPHNLKGERPEGDLPEYLKENPFRAPEGYFENFHEKLMSRQEIDAFINQPRVIPLYRRIWAVAATILIMAGLASLVILSRQDKYNSIDLQYFTIDIDDLEQEYPFESLDEYTLVNFCVENENAANLFGEGAIQSTIKQDTFINNQDIEQYLMQSNDLENLLIDL